MSDKPQSDDDVLVPVFMPPLVVLLANHERQKGSPLTEVEVCAIRDSAICITMRQSAARAMAEQRGFDDIDPADVWQAWQALRSSQP